MTAAQLEAVIAFFEDESSVFPLTEALDAALTKRDDWLEGQDVPFEGTVSGQMRLELVAVLCDLLREKEAVA